MVSYNNIHLRFCNDYLIFGDNLDGLHYCIDVLDLKGKVDLVYIDPPYNTGRVFRMGNSISRSENGNIAYNDKYDFDEYLRFIRASSNRDSIVLDCFCGSGTTLKVARDNNRSFIGVDSGSESVKLLKRDFKDCNGIEIL